MSRTREATSDVVRRGMWRSRWAAIGAAIAVSLGAGGLFVAQAAPGPSESTIVTVTPERILDTRDPNNIGLAGPFVSAVSQKLKVTGSIATATGTKTVVPTGATGVLLNVTPVNPTANGFISIRPGDATGAATTSSLNFTTGVAGIVPNAVQVAVPTAGANAGNIDITYDAYGVAGPTTDILIDVVGYMTSAGLQELVADVANKVPQGEIVMSEYPRLHPNDSSPATITNFGDLTRVTSGSGIAQLALEGPRQLGAVTYGLKSITYCVTGFVTSNISSVRITGVSAAGVNTFATDNTVRSTAGCYTLNVNDPVSQSYLMQWFFAGGAGQIDFKAITTTWAPSSTLASSLSSGEQGTGSAPGDS